jgi:hypothetical protein
LFNFPRVGTGGKISPVTVAKISVAIPVACRLKCGNIIDNGGVIYDGYVPVLIYVIIAHIRTIDILVWYKAPEIERWIIRTYG